MNRGIIVPILAVIGAIVVAGWVLRITFSLLGPLIVIGGCVLLYMIVKDKRIGGPN